MSQPMGILVFAAIIVVIGLVAVGYFVLSLRSRNKPSSTEHLADKPNVPRDPTMSRQSDTIEDNAGNYSRQIPGKPDADK